MSWAQPSVADFKAVFTRDFPYAPVSDPLNTKYVTDADISRAINDAIIEFNDGLFGAFTTQIFMYLAAYNLVQNIQTAMKGMSAQAQFVMNSTNVGGVSVGNMVVGQFADDPYLSKYLKNAYGQKYVELVHPYLIGRVRVAEGATTDA